MAEPRGIVGARFARAVLYLYFVFAPPAIAYLLRLWSDVLWRAGRTLCTRVLVHALLVQQDDSWSMLAEISPLEPIAPFAVVLTDAEMTKTMSLISIA